MLHAEMPPKQTGRDGWRDAMRSPWAIAFAVAAFLAAVAAVSLQRTFLGTGVELDFSFLFAQEALRIMRGDALLMPYHPAGYAFVLAAARSLAGGSWLSLGLWISWLSVLVVVVTSVATWSRLAGPAAAWGALLAIACSVPFRVSASIASSDMFFTALVCLLLMLMTAALRNPRRTALWAACGVVAALTILTRTNGVLAAAVLALPFLAPAGDSGRGRNFAAVTLAFLVPLAAWVVYAHTTGSPLVPVKNHMNLAVAAYGDGVGKWVEQMERLYPLMTNTTDVILHDPARFVRQIALNVATMPYHVVRTLTWPPISLLAAAGLLLMLWKRRTPAFLACFAVLAGMAALSGTVHFIPRLHLMLIPFIGAMAAVAVVAALDALPIRGAARAALAAAATACALAVSAWISPKVFPRIEIGVQPEFAEASAAVRRRTETDALIYSRSASLVLESGRAVRYLPSAATASELRTELCRKGEDSRPAYVYVGSLERALRESLAQELARNPPPWLPAVAHGSRTEWTLYRFEPGQSSAASCSSSSAA